MALLNHPRTTPPDGFRYCQMETQSRFTSETLGELVDVVIEHRRYKSIEPTDRATVELEVQRQMCAFQFPGICRAENGEDYRPIVDQSRSLNPDKVWEFTKAAYRFIESGGEMVPKEESERRAHICRGCPLNRPSTCICTPLHVLLDKLIPDSRRESGLAICGACGCGLGPKVLLPMSTIRSDNNGKDLRFPDFCWMTQ